MHILDLLIRLEDEGFPVVLSCDSEIVVVGPHQRAIPPDLAYQLRVNRQELLAVLVKVSRERLRAIVHTAPET